MDWDRRTRRQGGTPPKNAGISGKTAYAVKRATALLIPAFIIVLLFAAMPQNVSALSIEKVTRYYRLDTGVTFLWCNSAGKWQNGYKYGDTSTQHPMSYTWSLPSAAKIVSSGKYNPAAAKGQRGYFPFENTGENEIALWSEPVYGKTKAAYDQNYAAHTADMLVTSSDGANPVKYSMSFPNTAYNLKRMLSEGDKQKVYNLLGSPDSETVEKMNLLDPSSESYNANVQGYMYFTPTVIEYTISETIELGDLAADLDLKTSAKQGASYTVADASVLSNEIYPVTALLEKSYDQKTWTELIIWKGSSGKKGQNTGGSITQSEQNKGSVYYRITVTTDDGQTDTATKKIVITDSRTAGDFDVELSLPETTYEGHPVEAVDESVFAVEDGEDTVYYSARKFYKAGLGDNDMETNCPAGDYTQSIKSGSSGAVHIFTFNKANVKNKYYTVTLTVDVDGAVKADSREIQVLDCPSITETLSGKQKANRKQVLDIKVITNPNRALKTLWLELETDEGSERVHLDHNFGGTNTLENSDLIKTRAITKGECDSYFTNIHLEFLTKNTTAQNFTYRIYAEDAGGKSDLVEKTFSVAPDLAPEAALFTENTQLRNQGSDTAEICLEDRSKADSGDELTRAWFYREAETAGASEASGSAGDEAVSAEKEWIALSGSADVLDTSFGRLKSLIHSHDGVGKLEYRIEVKDVWSDETLPEYVSESDYLSDAAEITTDVVNVAPQISLELTESIGANVAVIAGSEADKDEIAALQNDIQAALIEEGVEANLSIEQMSGDVSSDDSTDIGSGRTVATHDTGSMNAAARSTFFNNKNYAVDKDTFYIMSVNYSESAISTGDTSAWPASPFTITAYDGYTGAVKWEHVLTSAELAMTYSTGISSSYGALAHFICDKSGNYVFFASETQTAVIERESGAYLTTLDFVLGDETYSQGRYIYTLKKDGIYSISSISGEVQKLLDALILTNDGLTDGDDTAYRYTTYISDYEVNYSYAEYSRLCGGNVEFVIYKGPGLERGYLNLKSGAVATKPMDGIYNYPTQGGAYKYSSGTTYSCLGFDTAGNVMVREWRNFLSHSETAEDSRVYVFDSYGKLIRTVTPVFKGKWGKNRAEHVYPVKNEDGTFTYIAGAHRNSSSATYLNLYSVSEDAKLSFTCTSNMLKEILYATQLGDSVYVLLGQNSDYSYAKTIKFDLGSGSAKEVSGALDCVNFGNRLDAVRAGKNLIASSYAVFPSSDGGFESTQSAKVSSVRKTMDMTLNQAVIESAQKTYINEDANVLVICDSKYAENTARLSKTLANIEKNKVSVVIAGSGELSGYQSTLYSELAASGAKVYFVPKGSNPAAFTKRLASAIAAAAGNDRADVYRIVKNAGAEASSLTKTFNLTPGSTYYYEYDIKASDGKQKMDLVMEKQLLSDEEIAASGQFTGENYYVTAVEKEDFESETRNDFFTFKSYGTEFVPKIEDGAGVLAEHYNSKSSKYWYRTWTRSISFSVPEGKKAILSFDLATTYASRFRDIQCTQRRYAYAKIDGEMWNLFGKAPSSDGQFQASYTHPYILTEGEHTIDVTLVQCRTEEQNARLYIDNLAVSFIDEAKPEDTKRLADKAQETGNDWYHHSGAVYAPEKTSMYAGQKAEQLEISGITLRTRDYGALNIKNWLVNDFTNMRNHLLDFGTNYGLNTKLSSDSLWVGESLNWYKANLENVDVSSYTGSDGYSSIINAYNPYLKLSLSGVQYSDSGKQALGGHSGGNVIETPSDSNSSHWVSYRDLYTQGEVLSGANTFGIFHTSDSYASYFEKLNTTIVSELYEPVAKGNYFISVGDVKNSETYEYLLGNDNITYSDAAVFMANKTYDGKTEITLTSADDEWYLADFKLYTIKDGKRIYMTEENIYDPVNAATWTVTDGALSVGTAEIPEKGEDVPLIYKKGELVMYNVYYTDYENDPSKASYWKYTHTPWNDGTHPDAAVVVDKYGETSAGTGSVLTEPIDKFYVDGKYTVEHWQYDDTGNPAYDKMSNIAKITFFVKGEAGEIEVPGGDDGSDDTAANTPPEVKSLTSVPAAVEEDDEFRIRARVDDAEQDELIVVIEVYLDGQQIYTWRDNHFTADTSSGEYPLIETDSMPEKAKPGKYSIICTVQDETGIDIKSYEFKVEHVERYGISGSVYHTGEWDKKRQSYNLQTFAASSDEDISLKDYVRLAAPRMRYKNVFWNGERFLLSADVLGNPLKVTAKIEDSSYQTELVRSGALPGSSGLGGNGEASSRFSGSLWDLTMNGRWGLHEPEEIGFVFTAVYADGKTAVSKAAVIMDDTVKYIRMHRRY